MLFVTIALQVNHSSVYQSNKQQILSLMPTNTQKCGQAVLNSLHKSVSLMPLPLQVRNAVQASHNSNNSPIQSNAFMNQVRNCSHISHFSIPIAVEVI